MSNKAKDNQDDLEPCSLILLHLGYNAQYILPIEDGMKIVAMLAGGIQLHTDYQKPKRLSRVRKFEIEYMTETDLNIIRIESALQPEDDPPI